MRVVAVLVSLLLWGGQAQASVTAQGIDAVIGSDGDSALHPAQGNAADQQDDRFWQGRHLGSTPAGTGAGNATVTSGATGSAALATASVVFDFDDACSSVHRRDFLRRPPPFHADLLRPP